MSYKKIFKYIIVELSDIKKKHFYATIDLFDLSLQKQLKIFDLGNKI